VSSGTQERETNYEKWSRRRKTRKIKRNRSEEGELNDEEMKEHEVEEEGGYAE
jgi:hypothetical protein